MPTSAARPRTRPLTDTRLHRRWGRATLAVAFAVAAVLVGAGSGHADDQADHTISEGAVTAFDVRVEPDGVPALQIATGTATYPPESVVLEVDGDAATTVIPQQVPGFYQGFVAPGDTVYQVPAVATPGLPTIGWSTHRLVEDDAAADGHQKVAIDLDVTGPGSLVVLGADGNGAPVPHVDTRDARPDVLQATPGGHGWLTWLFERPGRYVIDAQPRLLHGDGLEALGEPARYVIDVTAPANGTETPSVPGDPTGPPGDPATPPQPSNPPADDGADRTGHGAVSARDDSASCEVPGLAPDASTVAEGHFDYGVQVQGDRLLSRVKDDRSSPPTWQASNKLLFSLGAAARREVPSGPAYAFLGQPGDPVWTIGQTQESGVPWLGWNTQHPSAIEGIVGATTWRLDEVEGPGQLFIYQTGSLGGLSRLLGLAEGWPRELRIQPNTHAHGNWSFTEPGIYKVRTTHRATLRSGETVSSSGTLFFQVGPCEGGTRPTGPLPDRLLLADKSLRSGNRHGVLVDPGTVTAGESVAVTAPRGEPGGWLMPVLYSTPRQLGWKQVSPTRELPSVKIPSGTAPGRHKLAVYDEDGLVGWAPLRVVEPQDDQGPAPEDPPAKQQDTNPSPAPLTPAPGAPPLLSPACVPSSDDDAPAPGSTDDERTDDSPGPHTSVSEGHFDFGPEVTGGDLVARVKDDRTQPPSWVAPESFRFVLGSAAEQEVPAGGAYSFLGSPGDPIWLISQTQVPGVPWLGWNTQHESVRADVRGPVRFTLDRVSGPGRLAVYLTDSFGGVGEKVFGTASGFPKSFQVPTNVHAHGNWAFTARGSYQVTFTVSATLANGTQASGQGTLSFTVGGPANAAPSRTTSAFRSGPTVPVLALNTEDEPGEEPSEEPGDDAENDDENDDETEDEPGTNCTLPDTGADTLTTVLLPLGLGLLFTGGALLLLARRTAAVPRPA